MNSSRSRGTSRKATACRKTRTARDELVAVHVSTEDLYTLESSFLLLDGFFCPPPPFKKCSTHIHKCGVVRAGHLAADVGESQLEEKVSPKKKEKKEEFNREKRETPPTAKDILLLLTVSAAWAEAQVDWSAMGKRRALVKRLKSRGPGEPTRVFFYFFFLFLFFITFEIGETMNFLRRRFSMQKNPSLLCRKVFTSLTYSHLSTGK